MRRYLDFLAHFLSNPKTTGAIAPSSPRLARAMVDWIAFDEARAVVEFGPGDGAFTGAVRNSLGDDALFFALEIDERMCARLRVNHPDVTVYCDSAAKAPDYLERHNADLADAIVCGMPWATFSAELQDELLTATLDSLAPGGRFATFAYLQGLLLPSGRRFRKRLDDAFSEVTTSRVVWRNLPPAIVYQCVK